MKKSMDDLVDVKLMDLTYNILPTCNHDIDFGKVEVLEG